MSQSSSVQSVSPHQEDGGLQIALIQDHFQVGDLRANVDRMIQLSAEASAQGAELIVFPELALTGYPPEDLLHRPGFIASCQDECQRLVEALPAVDVVFGLPLVADESGLLYNSALWVRDNTIIASYAKQSLPNYAVFDEVRYFIAGDKAVNVMVKGVRVALSICEDIWQPDIVADGADLIVVLNASPFHIGKYEERVQTLQNRVQETGLPVVYVNLAGGQDELVFDGASLALDATGQLVARGPAFQPAQILLHYQQGVLRGEHAAIAPVLSTDAMIYAALLTGVRHFVRQNGFSKVVIGLSGGVDSALTLAIAVDALGAENVHAVMMPSRYTADISQQDARLEAEKFGVRFDIVEIEAVFQSFLTTLAPVFNGAKEDVTEENLQARCRGVLLMAISNKTGAMVLTTGNKSEMAVGYATLYGDMCGGFAPLKDVCKTRVYALCRYRNSVGAVIPERVLTRPPTAELREGQLDQDSLPDYEILDRILALSIEQDIPVDEIVAQGIDRETVMKVINLVQRNEYKRRQSAPGIRITRRAFGRDRRYPITSGYPLTGKIV